MAFLEKLTSDHRQLMVRLPYRVGLWVSRSDSAGGGESDQRESQALSNILHAFAEDLFGSETVQQIISETINRKAEWPQWGGNLDMVPGECRDAVDLLRQHGEGKDARVLQNHLMEIAEAVALAFREDDSGVSAFAAFGMYVRYMFSGSKKGRKVSFAEFRNISANERKALDAIADALEAA